MVPVFFWYELRKAKSPLVPFEILRVEIGFVLACVSCGWGSFGIWVCLLSITGCFLLSRTLAHGRPSEEQRNTIAVVTDILTGLLHLAIPPPDPRPNTPRLRSPTLARRFKRRPGRNSHRLPPISHSRCNSHDHGIDRIPDWQYPNCHSAARTGLLGARVRMHAHHTVRDGHELPRRDSHRE